MGPRLGQLGRDNGLGDPATSLVRLGSLADLSDDALFMFNNNEKLVCINSSGKILTEDIAVKSTFTVKQLLYNLFGSSSELYRRMSSALKENVDFSERIQDHLNVAVSTIRLKARRCKDPITEEPALHMCMRFTWRRDQLMESEGSILICYV